MWVLRGDLDGPRDGVRLALVASQARLAGRREDDPRGGSRWDGEGRILLHWVGDEPEFNPSGVNDLKVDPIR